jgi:multidrug efflux pump subunit AcrA (membrane-fusion protein)
MPVRSTFLTPLLLTGVVALSSGCGDLDGTRAAHAQSPPTVVNVETSTDEQSTSPPLVVAGVVRSAESVAIHAYVDGEITSVAVQVGDAVQAGDLLVELQSPELVQLVEEARAKLAQAEALARVADIDGQMAALEITTSLGEWEADYDAAVASLASTRFESTRTVHDQQRNMSYTLSDVERGNTDLSRARNQLVYAGLQREATQARGASLAISLAKSEREKQRMEELQSKDFASSSAVEEAQLSYATAVTASEEHKQDLSARDEDVKAALEEIASSERLAAISADALSHDRKSLEAVKEGREASEVEAELSLQKTGVRRDATRAFVDLDVEKSAHTLEAAAAGVRAARAAVKVAEQQVGWLRVTAPVDGVVLGLHVSVGELARSGRTTYASETPLLTLGDPERLAVTLALPAARLLGVGATVRVSLPDGSKSLPGDVYNVRRSENDAHTYMVTVALPVDASISLGSVVAIRFP